MYREVGRRAATACLTTAGAAVQFVEDVGVSATDTVVVYDAQGMFR